jgi:hypothetical protein
VRDPSIGDLRSFPIDTIRIDQSFIDDIDIDGGDGGDGASPNIVAVVERVENGVRRRAPLTMVGCLHWTFVKFSLAR